jgi:hypothetical protein
MKRFLLRGCPALALFAAITVLATGCGGSSSPATDKSVAKAEGGKTKAKDDHSGWWCDEHALPEEVCDLCSKKYRAAEKAKGNWCEHERVKSSCFKCNPDVRAKYAAEYKAKFGTEPPAIEDDEKKDDGKAKDKDKK